MVEHRGIFLTSEKKKGEKKKIKKKRRKTERKKAPFTIFFFANCFKVKICHILSQNRISKQTYLFFLSINSPPACSSSLHTSNFCYMKLFHDKCQVIKYMYQVKKYLGKIWFRLNCERNISWRMLKIAFPSLQILFYLFIFLWHPPPPHTHPSWRSLR